MTPETYIATPLRSTARCTSCDLPGATLDLTTRDGATVVRVVLWAEDGTYSVVRWVEGSAGWDLLGRALAVVAGLSGGAS